jgi:hypothetical protein
VCLDDALVIRIRELSRSEQAIQQQQVRVANQLRDLVALLPAAAQAVSGSG